VIGVEDWAEIRRLHRAEGVPIKEIARRLEVSRNTVRAALRSDYPPAYRRESPGSIVDGVEAQIRGLLGEWPTMPATVIAERIGWTRSIRVLRDRVAELRPLFVPPDACQRTEYLPGELAQWDLWFPAVDIGLGCGQVGRPPVIVGVAGYSRWLVGRMIPSRAVHDILGGHLACLLELGGVPKAGVYDNEPALAARHGGRAKPTQAFDAFRGTLGMGAVFCKPGDPEAKGIVSHCTSWCWLGGNSLGEAASLTFDEAGLAGDGRVEESGVAVVGLVTGEQAGSLPGLDGGGVDVEGVGDLGDGELAGGAEPIVPAGELVVAA
jgi:transposase